MPARERETRPQTTTSIAKAIKTAKKHGVDTDEIEVLIRILEVESIAGDSTQADKIIEWIQPEIKKKRQMMEQQTVNIEQFMID